eukprot:9828966-Alexandrium_andersonii.AAC.1
MSSHGLTVARSRLMAACPCARMPLVMLWQPANISTHRTRLMGGTRRINSAMIFTMIIGIERHMSGQEPCGHTEPHALVTNG